MLVMRIIASILASALVLVIALFILPEKAFAHCDTLDGPVVTAARKALNTDNVNYVLIWVKPENEDEVRKALKKAREKRKRAKTKEEKDKADMEFFGTLIKIHREGEGAKYEGVKPAGTIEPEIALADKAVNTGNLDKVLTHIKSEHQKEMIRHLFHAVQDKSGYDVNNVAAGREFIEAYVTFIHSVEAVVKGHKLPEGKNHQH